MSDIIRVPYTELFQRASRIRQQAEVVRTEIRNLNETVSTIDWMGQRAEKFFKMWEDTRPTMESWVTTLEAFANDLENQARRMQSADEAF
jgi:WXG100 family type VII secretion target